MLLTWCQPHIDCCLRALIPSFKTRCYLESSEKYMHIVGGSKIFNFLCSRAHTSSRLQYNLELVQQLHYACSWCHYLVVNWMARDIISNAKCAKCDIKWPKTLLSNMSLVTNPIWHMFTNGNYLPPHQCMCSLNAHQALFLPCCKGLYPYLVKQCTNSQLSGILKTASELWVW